MAQRIVFVDKGRVELQPFALGEPGDGELLLRTLYSLVSIGTETTILHRRYDAGTHFDRMFSYPQLKTGVQAVGVVEKAGAKTTEFGVGDVVYMRMAHGSHQLLPEAACSPIPVNVDLQQACWAGLAKTAFRTAWAAPFKAGGSVLVIGAGPVGQMTVRWAAALRVSEIVVVDISPLRLGHAQAGGATRIVEGPVDDLVDELRGLRDGAGAALVVDASGNPAVFQAALAVAARYGKVMLLGDTGYPGRQCLTSDVMTKGLTIQATHDSHDIDGWTTRRVDAHFFALLGAGRFPLDGLISHRYSPAECAAAYALASEGRGEAIGILFDWSLPA